MDKILLTTDFSKNSLEINAYAIKLYGEKVNYILLNGFICDYAQSKKMDGETFTDAAEFRQYMHDKAMASLEAEKTQLLELYPAMEIKLKAIEGIGIRAIETATRIYSPDLVVVGTSTLDTAPSKTHSSVATRLIGSIPTDILVVPYKYTGGDAKNVVFAYAHPEMNNEIVAPFKYLIRKAKRSVTMLHVIEAEDDVFSNEAVEDFANYLEIKQFKIENVKSRQVVDTILTYCENEKPDLLVVVARKETYVQDFWIGTKVDELACQLLQPMLALYDAP